MKSTAYKDQPFPVLVPEHVEGVEGGKGNSHSHNDTEAYPYEYGFRYVEYTLPDGTQKRAEQPLTIEDILFPKEGDQVAHREDHNVTTSYLRDGMKVQGVQDATIHIVDDVLIDFGVEIEAKALPAMCPDVAMVKGELDMDKLHSIVRVAEDGVDVVLVAEVTSPGTRHIDVPETMLNAAELRKLRREQEENPNVRSKFELYALAGIPIYVISDNARRKDRYTPPPFHVFRLKKDDANNEDNAYEELVERDDDGRVWIEEVNMSLGQGQTDLAWFNKAGKELGSFVDLFLENEHISSERDESRRMWFWESSERRKAEQERDKTLAQLEEAKRLQLEAEERAAQEREKALEEQRKAEQEREEEKRLRLEAEERAAQERERAEQEREEEKRLRLEAEERAAQEHERAEQERNKVIETIRKLLAKGMDPSVVAECTGLSTDDIAALSDEAEGPEPTNAT